MSKLEPKVKAKIGLLPTGLKIYWEQFPSLKEKGLKMYDKLVEKSISNVQEVITRGANTLIVTNLQLPNTKKIPIQSLYLESMDNLKSIVIPPTLTKLEKYVVKLVSFPSKKLKDANPPKINV